MKTAHGAELLASHKMPNNDGYVILVKWGEQYVTARMNALTDNEWYWGNYFRMSAEDGFSRAFGDLMRRSGKAVEPVE